MMRSFSFFARAVRALSATMLLSMVSAPIAHAQLGIDRSEIFIRPALAAERVGVINVTNTSDRAVQAIVKLEDWDRAADGANRWFAQGTVPGGCGGMLTVFPMSLNLAPGASQSIRLTANDSSSALTRECWSAVMLETAQAPADRGGVSYIIRSAVKVYVAPEGLQSAGEVVDMRTVRDKAGADSLEVWFRNSGERHYIAKGSVEFRRTDNSVAARLELEDYYLLPGARQRGIIAAPKLAAGQYIAIAMMDFGGGEIAAMQMEYVVATADLAKQER